MGRAQVSIYVIIGIIVVFLAGLGYFYSTNITTTNINNNKIQPLSENFLDSMIEQCMHDRLIDTINEYGICDTENKIKEALMTKLPACIDLTRFKEAGYTIDAKGKPDLVEAYIRPNSIDLRLVYPIALKKEDEKIQFNEKYYSLSRTQSVQIDFDFSGKAVKDYVLVSPDMNSELAVFKGTKVTVNTKKIDNISVFMKEMCPDDPSVVGKIKYLYSPENILFSPDAFLTIKYWQSHVSRLASEDKFKVAFLQGNHWEPVISSDNKESDWVRTSVGHLSEWIASCDGTNKYGIQVIPQELISKGTGASKQILDADLKCASNFSGPCGYAKLVVYLKEDNAVDTYAEAINKIYEQHLIPVLTIKEQPPTTNWEDIWYYKHPGLCEAPLDCKYGENEDGSAKPSYDYNGNIALLVAILDKAHKDRPQWPLYLELWEEPNLASEWGDISVTDYQIDMYGKYFKKLGEAVKLLPHSEAIKIMPAGLAPTNGMKRCMLTPKFDKQYDASPDNAPIVETRDGAAYLEVGDCKKLKYLPDYFKGNTNYCEPEQSLPPPEDDRDCSAITMPCTISGQPTTCPDTVAIDNCCTGQKNYIRGVLNWKKYYEGSMSSLFSDQKFKDPVEECTPENVRQANVIIQRIQDTVVPFCWEKITEVPTNEFLTKLYKGQFGGDMCRNMDLLADHSYPAEESLATYPGGQVPFGMLAYVTRFDIVKGHCSSLGKFKCTSANNGDSDGDNIIDLVDNCPYVSNADQSDWDKDAYGDVCDDSDKDNTIDSQDKCPKDSEVTTGQDTDNDGWADICDNCPNTPNPDQKDLDLDIIGDICDEQTDDDTIPNIGYTTKCVVNNLKSIKTECIDNCPYETNPDQKDEDGDEYGDACDNCVNYPNPTQRDWNKNGKGDICEDSDNDGFFDNEDLCPTTPSTENKPELCQATELCMGKVMITETAWAPHVDIYPNNLKTKFDFNVDNYVAQMSSSFDTWKNDRIVLSAIPFHLGEEDSLVPEYNINYSWTKKICTDSCVGKQIYNTVGKVENPISDCKIEGPIPGGPCTNNRVTIQNLGKEVGPNRVVYTCYKCTGEGTYKESLSTFYHDSVKVRACANSEPTLNFAAEESSQLLQGWSYRKPITITNNGGALENYQILVTLDTSYLISSGKMRSDCADIRFTESDGQILLNYWLDPKAHPNANTECNKQNTAFWIKLPNLPSGTKTIYLNYGNNGATTLSNPETTMEFYDSFEKGIDSSKWLTYKTSPDSDIVTAATKSYDGGNSVKVWQSIDDSTRALPPATPGQASDPDTYLYHLFAATKPRIIELAFYDDTKIANYGHSPLSIFKKGSGRAGLQGEPSAYFVINNDPAFGKSNYLITYPGNSWKDTGIERTDGWHVLKISNCDNKLNFFVDDKPTGINVESDIDGFGIADAWGNIEGKRLESEPTGPEVTFTVNGINYVYKGMDECFETKDLDLSQYCPDKDGTVLEGIPCGEVNISGTKYFGLIKCEPSLTSTKGWFHACGTAEQCDYSGGNCCEAGGTYGNWYHTCKAITSS
jgi:hypothetical protein